MGEPNGDWRKRRTQTEFYAVRLADAYLEWWDSSIAIDSMPPEVSSLSSESINAEARCHVALEALEHARTEYRKASGK